MAFPKHSILQALSVLLLAWVLVHCQTPINVQEGEEKESNIATIGLKSEVIECPLNCKCTPEGAVECAGVDLTEFPAKLSENTRQLSLQVHHTTAHTNTWKNIWKFCPEIRKLPFQNSVFGSLMTEQQN